MTSKVAHQVTDDLFETLRLMAAGPDRMWRSLPPKAYCSRELFELEVEHLFHAGWVLVGRADEIPNPGDYFSFDVLDEPIVVVRGISRELRVFSRVCRHRWMQVCAGRGNTVAFVCPYHAWTYELDGRLRHAPEMADSPGFDSSRVALPEIRTEVWEGFIFVNINAEAAPLHQTLKPARQQLAQYNLAGWRSVRSIDLGECPWDWKVFMDNGEIYHHMALHKETVEPRSPSRLSAAGDNNGEFFLLYGPAAPEILTPDTDGLLSMPSYLQPMDTWSPAQLTQRQRTSAIFFYPYPNHAIVLLVNIGIYFRVIPLAPGRCTIQADYIVPGELLDDPGLDTALDQAVEQLEVVIEEDALACSAVQKSVRSRFAATGSLSRIEDHNDAFARWFAKRITVGASKS